jgi:hypothetical protein
MSAMPEARVLIAMAILAFALIGAPAEAADVHKCRNADGQTVYQQAPCEKTGSSGKKIELKEPLATGGGKGKPGDGAGKSMNEAFHRRMDARDYDGALAFATTDAQMIAQKNTRCATLAQKMQKTQAEVRPDSARSKAAADAAASEYALNCR